MKRVLLVDDDADFLKVLEHSLRKEKLEISCCSSGELALELLSKRHFDIVISDYKMGPVSGLTIAREAQNRKHPIPVILLTAFAEEFSNNAWGSIPAKILSKPVEFRKLAEAIDDLCNDLRKKLDRAMANSPGDRMKSKSEE